MNKNEIYNSKFMVVSKLIEVLYDLDGCECGGLCHIVTDDDNIYDNDLDWVIEWCNKEENKDRVEKELCILICTLLKQMTFKQRAILFDIMNCGSGYFLEDCESVYTYLNDMDMSINEIVKSYDHRHEFIKEE